MQPPLSWSHRTADIPDTGLSVSRSASPAERAAIAEVLEVISCEQMTADYVIRALGDGRYRMSGKVLARLTQPCVVTLEPISTRIEEAFEVQFWPAESLAEPQEAEVEVLSVPDIEPLERATIAAGRVIYELLSAALDPFPRKPGARFEWEEADAAPEPGEEGPFTALKKLKGEQ